MNESDQEIGSIRLTEQTRAQSEVDSPRDTRCATFNFNSRANTTESKRVKLIHLLQKQLTYEAKDSQYASSSDVLPSL
jgi:hypothetical protein